MIKDEAGNKNDAFLWILFWTFFRSMLNVCVFWSAKNWFGWDNPRKNIGIPGKQKQRLVKEVFNQKRSNGSQEHIHALQVLDDSARHGTSDSNKLVIGNVTYKNYLPTPL